jgi:hypothetical protein
VTRAEALDYAIDYLAAFQPRTVTMNDGRTHYALPGHELASVRERYERAMEHLRAMRKEADQ